MNVSSILNKPTIPYIAVINHVAGNNLTSLFAYHFGNDSFIFTRQKPETAKNITFPNNPQTADDDRDKMVELLRDGRICKEEVDG